MIKTTEVVAEETIASKGRIVRVKRQGFGESLCGECRDICTRTIVFARGCCTADTHAMMAMSCTGDIAGVGQPGLGPSVCGASS